MELSPEPAAEDPGRRRPPDAGPRRPDAPAAQLAPVRTLLRDDGLSRPLYAVALKFLQISLTGCFGFSASGREHIPPTGPVLLVLNHCADVDPPFVAVGVAPRRCRFLAASRHFHNPFLRWVITGLGAIPIEVEKPDLATIRGARERLLRGGLVVVWPEGAPSYRDKVSPFREGVGHLALTPGVTVVPAALWGLQHVIVRGLPIGHGPTRMLIGPPIPVPEGGRRRDRAAWITAECRTRVSELLAELVREMG